MSSLTDYVGEPENPENEIEIEIISCEVCGYPFLEGCEAGCPACEYEAKYGKSGGEIAADDAEAEIKPYPLAMPKAGGV